MNLLEWYDILLWKKNKMFYFSTSDHMVVYTITKKGYELIGDMVHWASEVQNLRIQLDLKKIGQWEISKALDEEEMCSYEYVVRIKKEK